MNRNVVVTIGSMIFGSLTSGSIKISMAIARKRKNAMTLARRRKRNTIVSLVKNTDILAVIAKD
ncbi:MULTISPECIES: hypothetical protein [Bacillus]|uniref:hypothetical protein n=1 Tax=Bacillus TaxID=1386 RepID=UPI000BA8821F|nr:MULTISPECIES: hypothetical protein [Bacillus]AUZ37949.1 hypothetical protein C1T29_06400 [Bacillus sp. MBGLi79]NLS39018.1 hypothetical protein [Bacillus subtilis]POO84478.1 hypothetical protein C1T30_04195 [Bacillus sp. MBGLi97]MDZ5668941.1 hypothetical protein [Bacillus stercoris]PAO67294.1 hypothetical protein CIK44_18460 [Bacillus sp. X2(2017)]